MFNRKRKNIKKWPQANKDRLLERIDRLLEDHVTVGILECGGGWESFTFIDTDSPAAHIHVIIDINSVYYWRKREGER